MKALRPAGLALLLAACTTTPPPPAPEPVVEAPVAAPKPRVAPKESIKSQPLKHLVGRSLKAMPEKPLNVRTRCNFRDVAGGRGSMDLQVTEAEVKRFSAEISIPKQGLCRFDMKHFEQTARMPNVVLTDRASACTVRMWEQGNKVTIAFDTCPKSCEGDAFSYLWPLIVEGKSGRC